MTDCYRLKNANIVKIKNNRSPKNYRPPVWLTQKLMAELFQVKPQNITMRLKNIYQETELEEKATCKDVLQVQIEGNHREILHHAGQVSHELAKQLAEATYNEYNQARIDNR